MRFYSPSATGAPATVAAPSRQRSPIGRWFAHPVHTASDPAILALAAHFDGAGIPHPLTMARGVRAALIETLVLDHGNDDGSVTRYTSSALALAIGWPEAAGHVRAVLEATGITKDGRVPHWHAISGTRSPDERRRMQTRDRVRRFRDRQRLAQSEPTASPDSVTSRYPVTQSAAAYIEVRARACAGTGTGTHTETALRAKTKPRADVSEQPTAPDALPEAVAILATIWSGPVPASVARRITHEVHDVERWRRTVATWQSAGWHVGTGAIGAMLHRYRQDADGKRAKLALSGRPPGVRADKPALSAGPAQVAATHSPGTPPPTAVPPLPKPATPESRAAFARAFADSPFTLSQGRRASRSECDPRPATTTRPVPDLRSLPPDQRAAVALAALRSIGRAVTQATAVR